VDVSEAGIRAGLALAREAGVQDKVRFRRADVREPLPFPYGAFSALVCMDAMCHLPDRGRLPGEWRRVLRPLSVLLSVTPNSFTH
jgi:SAM-dependent methyltransferase